MVHGLSLSLSFSLSLSPPPPPAKITRVFFSFFFRFLSCFCCFVNAVVVYIHKEYGWWSYYLSLLLHFSPCNCLSNVLVYLHPCVIKFTWLARLSLCLSVSLSVSLSLVLSHCVWLFVCVCMYVCMRVNNYACTVSAYMYVYK